MRAWVLAVCGLVACNASESPNLSTTEQLSVVVGPASFNFGSVEIGTTSTPTTFTVSPAGTGQSDQTITSIIGCDNFEISAPGVPGAEVFRHCPLIEMLPDEMMQQPQSANEALTCGDSEVRTYQFTAAFKPGDVGNANCVGQIVMNNGVQSFSMTGNGIQPAHVIGVTPRSIGFGDIRVGDPSNPRTVTIANEGSDDLEVTVTLAKVPEIVMSKGVEGKQTISKGTSGLFDFTCTPSGTTTFNSTLTIDSNDPLAPKTTVAISCHGIMSELDINPDSFDVTTLVDKAQPATVTLHNEGNVPGVIKSITFSPDTNPDVTFVDKPADGDPIAGLGNALLTIQYNPLLALEQSDLGSVLVQFEDDAERVITISGGAKLAKVATAPTLVDFGPVCANLPSSQHVEVYTGGGAGGAPFNVTSVTAGSPFAIAPLQETAVLLPPGDVRLNLDVTISPAPPTMENQVIEGTLVLATTSPTSPSFELPMIAQPLDEGVSATKELSLGIAEIDGRSDAQAVKVTNCSDAPIMIMDEPRFIGANAADFNLIRAFQPTLIARAETIQIDVVFEPQGPGQRTAEMVIDFTGGTTSVALVGDALGEIDGRDTYYACSTGGDGAWPLGVVVIVIARRRRRRGV